MGRVEAAARVVRREGAAPARTWCCPVSPPRLYHLQRALSWMPLAWPGPARPRAVLVSGDARKTLPTWRLDSVASRVLSYL